MTTDVPKRSRSWLSLLMSLVFLAVGAIGIPEFIFIGHDDPNFRLVAQDNGALSFLTPEADTLEMVNSILNDEARDGYIDSNEEILRDQAEEFYGGIIRGIDPTIVLSFDFGQAS